MELALTQIDELKEWFELQWQEIQCCKANGREIAFDRIPMTSRWLQERYNLFATSELINGTGDKPGQIKKKSSKLNLKTLLQKVKDINCVETCAYVVN